MASRRKYKPPKAYKDGGAVVPDDIALSPESTGSDVQPAHSAPAHDDAVQRILQATLHADELQRAAPEPPRTVDDAISRMALSNWKKEFLREHPVVLTDQAMSQAMRHHYQMALQSGVQDDSDDMAAAIRSGLAFEQSRRRDRGVPSAMSSPTMSESSIHHSAERLAAEASALQAGSAPTIGAADYTADIPPPPPVPRPPSRPVYAPVSRETPAISGQHSGQRAGTGSITLSATEREVARNSYSGATNEEKERSYAMQKAKLLAMRQRGEYPESARD